MQLNIRKVSSLLAALTNIANGRSTSNGQKPEPYALPAQVRLHIFHNIRILQALVDDYNAKIRELVAQHTEGRGVESIDTNTKEGKEKLHFLNHEAEKLQLAAVDVRGLARLSWSDLDVARVELSQVLALEFLVHGVPTPTKEDIVE